ncbi:MAG: AIR synthase related protein [Ignisphaera sp.]|nr:AIR synthase related protein [Ignisphaera sp.]MCX8168144.1 AIR synthase related protein [Ignisphaera sp.]MDW8085216.1 AIR synthase related protein [Ignisphaera sp.]
MKELILKLAKSIKHHPLSLLTFYDDAGDIMYNSMRFLIKVDGFAFSRAKYAWCSYRDVGFRAVTAAVSDVIAKGCRPIAYAISVGLTGKSLDELEEVIRGATDAITVYGGYIVNIDTNSGNDDWIDVFVLADCKYAPIPRVVKPCNTILLPRRIGDTTIAYISHLNNDVSNLSQNLIEISCRPLAELKLVEVIEKHRNCITGSIDISDTFAEALYDLVTTSNYGILLNALPHSIASYSLLNFYYTNKDKYNDIIELILMANEEYVPVLAINNWCLDELTLSLISMGFEPVILGYGITENEVSWMGRRIPKMVWNHVRSRILLIDE